MCKQKVFSSNSLKFLKKISNHFDQILLVKYCKSEFGHFSIKVIAENKIFITHFQTARGLQKIYVLGIAFFGGDNPRIAKTFLSTVLARLDILNITSFWVKIKNLFYRGHITH
jgi:hypothetical protein